MPERQPRPLRIAVIGAGNRGADVYGSAFARRAPIAEVTAFADPDRARLERVGARFGLGPDALFADGATLLARVPDLDAVVVATPDRAHVAPAVEALARDLHVLLEKPIAPDAGGVEEIRRAAATSRGTVTVAHVLRYAPLFRTLKELLDAGRIGRLVAIRHSEHIGYWHFAHSFVRGNWRREAESSPMILAKACHDLDLLRWMADAPCRTVSSIGGLAHFRAENAPEGSTERCTDGCAVERSCPYSARRIYLERFAGRRDWPVSVVAPGGDEAALLEALRSGPYGRCVYHSDNDVADHQAVQLAFANGVAASLVVHAFSEEVHRDVHLMGSHGEIRADLSDSVVELHDFSRGRREVLEVGGGRDGHGGGDGALVDAFLDDLRRRTAGEPAADAPTTLAASIDSHLMAFAAERARREGRTVDLGASA
jgi:predicted dehydrogenase